MIISTRSWGSLAAGDERVVGVSEGASITPKHHLDYGQISVSGSLDEQLDHVTVVSTWSTEH